MKGKKELIIGLVILVALAIGIYGINYLKGVDLFNSNRTFYTQYANIQTLVSGSPVKLNGLQVGVVRETFLEETNQKENIVIFNISNEKLKISKGTKARIGSDLLGTSYIELILKYDTIWSPDSSSYSLVLPSELHVEGDTLTPDVEYGALEVVSQKIAPIEFKVNTTLLRVNNIMETLEGVIGKNGDNLNRSFQALRNMLTNLEKTTVTLDQLLTENKPKLGASLDNVKSLTANLEKNNEKINNILNNFSSLSDTLTEMDLKGLVTEAKSTLNSLTNIVNEINNGDGSLSQLIHSDSLVNGLNILIDDADRLIQDIEAHPNRYIQFSVFGSKDKGVKLDAREEKELKQLLNQ